MCVNEPLRWTKSACRSVKAGMVRSGGGSLADRLPLPAPPRPLLPPPPLATVLPPGPQPVPPPKALLLGLLMGSTGGISGMTMLPLPKPPLKRGKGPPWRLGLRGAGGGHGWGTKRRSGLSCPLVWPRLSTERLMNCA